MKNSDRKERLFSQLNIAQRKYDSSLGNNVRCPLCWQLFPPDSLQENLSLEHVPPTATARLIGEKRITTLTCTDCNQTYGRKYQNDLKNFVRHQLFESGKFSGSIRGKVTLPGTEPLKCNVIWNQGKWHIVGVPKANNPVVTDQHIIKLNEFVESQSTDWGFRLEGSFEYRLEYAWFSFLHAAYLLACIWTEYNYPYSKAGQVMREFLYQQNVSDTKACVVVPPRIGIGGKPWMALIKEQALLRSIWIKVAGNIVILPPDDDIHSCYKAWEEASTPTLFGLVPNKNTNLTMGFPSIEDKLEAQKCLPFIN